MPLDEAYFVWLYAQVGDTKTRTRSNQYWKLLTMLHRKPFTWDRRKMEMDGNRASDGKDLRKEFLNNTGTALDEPDWLNMECSFLEMLIALSWKLAFDGGGEPRDWFWRIIDNLGLLSCNDSHPPDEAIVDHILNRVINRTYAFNGAGGLFPLNEPVVDQRGVQIWYQGQAYILERI